MSDIEEHRKKIEEITLEMIKLLKTRTDIAKQIGDAKASLGMTVTDEEREDALRNQVTKLCKEIDLDQSTASKFLNLLLNESVKVQSDNKQTHLSVFLKAKELDELEMWGRYLDIDGDGVPYRTLPGTHESKGAFFTRGTSHDAFAGYTEDGRINADNLTRIAKKFDKSSRYLPRSIKRGSKNNWNSIQ